MVRVGAAAGAFVVSYSGFMHPSVRTALEDRWRKHFRWIFYGVCLSFAWIHIRNYELAMINLLMMPIITLPQLSSALIYSYTRVAFGFQYPLALHFCNNHIAVTITQL